MRLQLMIVTIAATLGVAACTSEDKGFRADDVDVAPDTSFGEVNFEIETRSEINLPPDFGDACDGNEDCSEGFCVEGPSGFVCTKTCVEECPVGWGCKGVQSGSADVIFVCVPDDGPADVTVGDADATDATDTLNEIQADTSIDTDTGPVSGNACEAPPGSAGETVKTEGSVPIGDWPDCIVGCDFETNPTLWVVDLRSDAFTAASGVFDADEHLYGFEDGLGSGPDIDVVAVKAPARTMMEFAVLKSELASFTEPLVYVSDGFQVRTFNSDVSSSNTCGRTTMAFPFVSDLPIYVVVEEASNYALWGPTGYDSGTVGGADYGWQLRIRTTPFAPTELGTLAIGQSRVTAGERLTVGGQLNYYRFFAPGTAKPTVTVVRRGGATFLPSVAGMKTIAGELVWQRVAESDDAGRVELAGNGFRACIPQSECPSGVTCPAHLCTEAQTEFAFAVFDYNGEAGPGQFSYDVTVRVD